LEESLFEPSEKGKEATLLTINNAYIEEREIRLPVKGAKKRI